MTEKTDKILLEAHERFRFSQEWESASRVQFINDIKFGNADATNNWQWEDGILNARLQGKKPCATVNRVRQYCLQIVNSLRADKPDIAVRAVGGGSSFKSAEIFEGCIRHIESQSNAQQAYDSAAWNAVFGGIGWFRICTDFASDDSFDQEIYIKRISDPLSIYADPHITEYDGSDMKYLFVFRDMDRKEFEKEFPKHKDVATGNPLSEASDDYGWNTKDRVRVAEYWRVVEESDTLHHLDNGSTVKESDVKDADLADQLKLSSIRSRDITTKKVEHYLLAGNKIIEGPSEWAGKYIPFCRVIGEELVVNKRLDRKGHVRALISPQQAYNYHTSAAIEHVALQSKVPWTAPEEAIEEHEEWKTANTQNYSVLTWNHMDDQGRPIPPPTRVEPPSFAAAYETGMQSAAAEMEMASGQPAALMGMTTNERSAKAIQERQKGGSTATYHYTDHLSSALRFCGRILIDMIPRIYDTPRILKILAVDGTPQTVQVDPQAPQAHAPALPSDNEGLDAQHVNHIFNPSVGQYDVVVDSAPNYATRRQESYNALSQIMQQNSAMAPLIADLWADVSDFPQSDEIAARLKRMLPPQATGQGPDPQVTQLQQMLAQQHQVMDQMTQELQAVKSKALASEIQKELDFYRAQTERMKAFGGIDPAAVSPIIREEMSQIVQQPINPIIAQHMLENSQMIQAAQIPGHQTGQGQPGQAPAAQQPPPLQQQAPQ